MVYAGTIPTCSLIIPAYNEENYIGTCLRSIAEAAGRDRIIEVIVIDNASADRTAETARAFPGVNVFREHRKGTSHARERGFREAKGDLLIFIDADSKLPKGWIERAERWFRDPQTVCVSGPYLCYDLPPMWNFLGLAYWWLLAVPASLLTGNVAVGGSMMIRRSALEAVGGFDTSVTFYGDDTNIAKRLKRVGTVHFDPRLVMRSSARRFKNEGMVKVACTYACNFWSQALANRSMTKRHEDVR